MGQDSPRVAVVGAGYWGKNLVRNFYNLGSLKTICDSNQVLMGRMLETYPGVQTVSAPKDVLADPEIDGVVVATPAETHGQIVKDALLAGKDVFVEKPLCLSTTEGLEINALAEEKKRILMVGHLLWYHPAVRRLKELVDSGELGRILYVYSNRLNLGKLRREENVLWSFAPHDISLILGILDEIPEHVQAQGGNYLHQEIADVNGEHVEFSQRRAGPPVRFLAASLQGTAPGGGGAEKKWRFSTTRRPWPEKLQLYAHTVEWPGNIPVAHKAEAEAVVVEEAEPLRFECQVFLDSIISRQKTADRWP